MSILATFWNRRGTIEPSNIAFKFALQNPTSPARLQRKIMNTVLPFVLKDQAFECSNDGTEEEESFTQFRASEA